MKVEIDLQDLRKFLVKAKRNSWAAGSSEVHAQRPGFQEITFSDCNLNYRDSWAGDCGFHGSEVVRFAGEPEPLWAMSYDGVVFSLHRKPDFVEQIFSFLKKALLMCHEEKPFRGPAQHEEADFRYSNECKGDIERFIGTERIFYLGDKVYRLNYIGGLIIAK